MNYYTVFSRYFQGVFTQNITVLPRSGVRVDERLSPACAGSGWVNGARSLPLYSRHPEQQNMVNMVNTI